MQKSKLQIRHAVLDEDTQTAEDLEDFDVIEAAYELFAQRDIRLHRGYSEFLVAVASDEVLAAAAIAVNPREEKVEFSVAVRPEHERKGLARRLVEEVWDYTVETAETFEWEHPELEAYVVNPEAMIPLLQSKGFSLHRNGYWTKTRASNKRVDRLTGSR